MMQKISLILSIVLFYVVCKEIEFMSNIANYELKCKLYKEEKSQSTGYLVGILQGSDKVFRLGRINLETGAVQIIGNTSFPTINWGMLEIDPINHRLFIKQPLTVNLLTVSLITGEILYKVNVHPDITYLYFDTFSGNIYGLLWNKTAEMELLVKLDYRSGFTTVVATPDNKYISNEIRTFNPYTKTFYFVGYENKKHILYKVNVETGEYSKVQLSHMPNALFSDTIENGNERLIGLGHYTGGNEIVPVKVDPQTGDVTMLSDKAYKFPQVWAGDKAFDYLQKTLMGAFEESNVKL